MADSIATLRLELAAALMDRFEGALAAGDETNTFRHARLERTMTPRDVKPGPRQVRAGFVRPIDAHETFVLPRAQITYEPWAVGAPHSVEMKRH